MRKMLCYIFGHNMFSIYSLNNKESFNGQPRSAWRKHKCSRCNYEEDWHFDFY